MASSSSSFWQDPAAAPAASQGPSIRVATLNIGVSHETACISEKKYSVFAAKLEQDLNTFISNGVQIICLQEVSEFWTREIRSILALWDVISGGNKVLIAYRSHEWDRDVQFQSKKCFNSMIDNNNPYRCWRKYLEAGQWMCPERRMCDFGKFTCHLRRSGFQHLNT